MESDQKQTSLAHVGTAIGIGLMAGLAGTLAMSLGQKIEMKITGRRGSDTPASAIREVFHIKPVTESKSEEVSNKVHLVYGTSLGLIRGALSLCSLKGWVASSIHFATVWGGSLLMLPALRVAPPIIKEKPKAIATDIIHHIIYAVAAGCVFDAINKKDG